VCVCVCERERAILLYEISVMQKNIGDLHLHLYIIVFSSKVFHSCQ